VDEPELGKVVLLRNVVDPQGNQAGKHYAIILTSKDEYAAGKPLRAVVVSSKLGYTAKECMVMMPWARPKHPQTGFSEKCAAICCWIVQIQETDIIQYGKYIWGSLLHDVISCVARAQAAKNAR